MAYFTDILFASNVGQLPQPYDVSDLKESTRLSRATFNDQNKQELNRFVKDPAKDCDFIVDNLVHVDDQSNVEPDFGGLGHSKIWKEELSIEFLDAKRSHPYFRAFYIPFYSRSQCNFSKYVVYKNISPKTKTKNKLL